MLILSAMLITVSGLAATPEGDAERLRDSVRIQFRVGRTELVPTLGNNGAELGRIVDSMRSYTAQDYRLDAIRVTGAASPEGSAKLNRRLSEGRAASLFAYLSQYAELPDSIRQFEYVGRDWRGLYRLVENETAMPYHEETLELLREIVLETPDGADGTDPLRRLRNFRGGRPYRYMLAKLFPDLRASQVNLYYSRPLPVVVIPEPEPEPVTYVEIVEDEEVVPVELPAKRKPFYMDLSTNLLYDACLVPNISAEFYLGANLSVDASWMYAWWGAKPGKYWWRTYGGDLELRWWFGRAAHAKPLTGHHIGIFGGMVTYDFELGKRGYLGPKWSYMGGLSYGYSLPIAKRLNMDFELGIGYLGGEYKEYLPIDGHYVWQVTKQRRYIGPVKAEVSLVWLIGRDNVNQSRAQKGEADQ